MKKFLSIFLCMAMLASTSICVFAKTDEVDLIYSNEATYEITLPTSLTLEEGVSTLDFSMGSLNLEEDTYVEVAITSKNYQDGQRYLVNTKNPEDKIAYDLEVSNFVEMDDDAAFSYDEVGEEKLVFGAEGAVDVEIELIMAEDKVGTFADTLTFTSEVKDGYYLEGFYYIDYTPEFDLSYDMDGDGKVYADINWSGDIISYVRIEVDLTNGTITYFEEDDAEGWVYFKNGAWTNSETSGKMTLAEKSRVSEEFYDWLMNNRYM